MPHTDTPHFMNIKTWSLLRVMGSDICESRLFEHFSELLVIIFDHFFVILIIIHIKA